MGFRIFSVTELAMVYILCGFLFGIFIPYVSRRFEKFMPATFAFALYQVLKPLKSVSRSKWKSVLLYGKLKKRFYCYSLFCGLVCAGLSALTMWRFGISSIGWHLFFIWVLLLLSEIDKRMFLLPDILTIPLLVTGFVYSVVAGVWVNPAESAIGAAVGYVLPVIATLLLIWKDKDMFGGGDIKLLTAVGAWVGPEKLLYSIVLSTVLFGIYALLQKKRDGAYGPAIAVSAIVVVFLM